MTNASSPFQKLLLSSVLSPRRMSNIRRLIQDMPWIQTPIIANAPMSGVATSELAASVTRAGGLGQIGFIDDMRILDRQLERTKHLLRDIKTTPKDADLLPIGVGIIAIGGSVSSFLHLLEKHKPAVIWLSFGETTEFAHWTRNIRNVSPHTKVWIQIGSVSAALQAAQACHPDALVLQGSDAGGHGHALGSSVITLVPEVADALHDNDINEIPLIAAGGIMDGRSTAAAMMLGASGVVMGTRFLGAEEANLPSDYRQEVLLAFDGGESTVRSRVFDEMWGPNPWPEVYDGRCLRNACYEDLQKGLSGHDIRARLYLNLYKAQTEHIPFKDTSSLWAGAGVGMLKRIEKARGIVEEVRSVAKQKLEHASVYI
ncbi:Oxidoreductase 2-nitropropane dioxygenase family [Aspergillus sclerotialis]|uniref:Oxidoreductase 2-nitropropane dioxygenase family n=1 Tax=Aspergillus sclerotialis TaxID=2070753 RepID=A0A3A2ZPB0_9EURO|nr:Oxidoreductase 2-nitropropane dioxygenase family [Aspergillus sclerotialis]